VVRQFVGHAATLGMQPVTVNFYQVCACLFKFGSKLVLLQSKCLLHCMFYGLLISAVCPTPQTALARRFAQKVMSHLLSISLIFSNFPLPTSLEKTTL
jgi:hypothetical protein